MAAQGEAKLVAWRKAFHRIPHKPLLHHVQGEMKTNVTCMQATSPSCTMLCSEAFHASLSDYGRALEKAKDRYYEPYAHAAGDSPGCLFMTLPCLPPLPSPCIPLVPPPPLLFFFPPLSLLRMLPPLLLRTPTLPPQLSSSPPLSSPPTSFPPMHVLSLCLFSSSRLPPPPCFSPFFLSLQSLSHHSFPPCLHTLPPSPHT